MGVSSRVAIALGYLLMACAMAGCPDTTGPNTPSADLSVTFHIEPRDRQIASPPQRLTYRVIVDTKGVLNAGVEFEVVDVSPLIRATVNPARISETARETELVVEVPSGTRPNDYDFTVRARLTVAGQGAPDWFPTLVSLRVPSNEGGFSVTCLGELAIPADQARTLTCRTIRDDGFTATIDLSFANRPAYLTIIPETASVGTGLGGFSFTVLRTAASGTPAFFDLVVIGQSGGQTRQSTTRIHLP